MKKKPANSVKSQTTLSVLYSDVIMCTLKNLERKKVASVEVYLYPPTYFD